MGCGDSMQRINPDDDAFTDIITGRKLMAVHKYIPGHLFNKRVSNIKLIKLTKYNEIHNNMKYKDGLNKDANYYSHSNRWTGIYFTDYTNMYKWIEYTEEVMYWYREVIIPDDARVRIWTNGAYNANNIILGKRQCIWKNANLCLSIVKKNPTHIKFVIPRENYSEICLTVIKLDIYTFIFMYTKCIIPDILKEIVEIMVKKDGLFIYLIKNPTPQRQLTAVKNNPLAINYIKIEDRTVEMIDLATDYLLIQALKHDYQNLIARIKSKNECTINGVCQREKGIIYLENHLLFRWR